MRRCVRLGAGGTPWYGQSTGPRYGRPLGLAASGRELIEPLGQIEDEEGPVPAGVYNGIRPLEHQARALHHLVPVQLSLPHRFKIAVEAALRAVEDHRS